MSENVRFVHISDSHIGPSTDYKLYDRNPSQSLQALVCYLNDELPFKPDFVLHTGDVTYDPDPVATQLAQELLSQLRYPVYFARGNHDDPDAMRRYLPNVPVGSRRLDYTFTVKDFEFIVLDSFGVVQPRGYLEASQIEWLRETCRQSTAESVVIVVHHLPALTGNAWLDRYMVIDNYEALFEALRPHRARIRGLFFGHIHSPSTVFRAGIVCSSPAATFNCFVFPDDADAQVIKSGPGGFSQVNISHEQTWVFHQQLGE